MKSMVSEDLLDLRFHGIVIDRRAALALTLHEAGERKSEGDT